MTITLKKTEEKSCEELVRELDEKEIQSVPIKLQFAGVEDKDVYNITAPFSDEGEEIIAGRVESRDSEHSEVYFFVKKNDKWKPKEDLPTFTLQDPFITFINNDLILGGVEISPHLDNPGALTWRTVFYRGKSINELKPFFTGPNGMKDLRLVELLSGEVGILTRPQGDKGGQGKIGFNKVKKLEDLTIEVIDDTPLLEGAICSR
ncbi:hypothetical protein JCM21714_3013 [Gracilibacillus boraciitolerans JCM 21714]|uniref:Uncharacterized protein n=1 Tax=Gracilibacillus boraciitolerans JCM 21714 TaxID=1298598 RepID=W4VM46_9BACI|nr:DUF1861 family protein [Gracilibacillus boraciitolerans]GAE93898.1 hypothetical protein JCM21714_3013 [Gracilibacillus boraciitolerans JCM 21714]